MTTVFHAWPYGRFIEIQSNLGRKKLNRTNQGSNFLEGSFRNRYNVRAQSNLEETVNTSIISKDDFSSRTDPSIFRLIAPVLLNEFFQHLNQQATYCSSPECLLNQIQVQKQILVVATDQMPDHT